LLLGDGDADCKFLRARKGEVVDLSLKLCHLLKVVDYNGRVQLAEKIQALYQHHFFCIMFLVLGREPAVVFYLKTGININQTQILVPKLLLIDLGTFVE
jgi:hypothetical protein